MEEIKKEIVKSNVWKYFLSVWLFGSRQCRAINWLLVIDGEVNTVIDPFSFFSYTGTKQIIQIRAKTIIKTEYQRPKT